MFGAEEIQLVARVASYVIKLNAEPIDKNSRIILLPPHGFTANKINELLPYAEVRLAKVSICGSVRNSNQRFSRLKDVVKFCYYVNRKEEIHGDYPAAAVDPSNADYREEVKSSNETFFSVKENGEGFYHNLINLTNEWIVLSVYRELVQRKKMNTKEKIANLSKDERKTILDLLAAIRSVGDGVFAQNKPLVNLVLEMSAKDVLPALIDALNIYETGKHEPCTVYAVILKLGRRDKTVTLSVLEAALKRSDAPKYYLEELIEKLS